jgi:hypothetical protein
VAKRLTFGGLDDGTTRVHVMPDRAELIAAHRELCEASDAVRHLLVVENLTQVQVDDARTRLSRAYERAARVDNDALRV